MSFYIFVGKLKKIILYQIVAYCTVPHRKVTNLEPAKSNQWFVPGKQVHYPLKIGYCCFPSFL